MKKIFLTSGLVVCMACPAFADVITQSTDGNCVVDVLGVSEPGSTATLEAQWDAIISGKITLDGARYASSSAEVDTTNPVTASSPAEVYSKYDTGMFSDSTAQTSITSVTKPVIAGYEFGGYYIEKTGTGTQVVDGTGDFTAAAKNIISTTGGTTTWFAKWTPKTYNITYAKGSAGTRTGNAISGSTAGTTATFDASATLATNGFNIDGYDFDKWVATKVLTTGADATGGQGYASGATITPYRVADDIELTATWTPKKYTVTYKCGLHGATGDVASACADFVDQDGATYDTAYTALTLAQATSIKAAPGYTFKEWNSEEEGTGATFTGIAAPWTVAAQDKVVHAIYTANAHTITYTCGSKGSASANITGDTTSIADNYKNFTYDAGYTLSPSAGTCALQGWHFAGWKCNYKLADGTNTDTLYASAETGTGTGVYTVTETGTFKVDANIQCDAQWTANNIGLTWYSDSEANEGTVVTVQAGAEACTYDGGITLPDATHMPKKTGYTFKGWNVRPTTE